MVIGQPLLQFKNRRQFSPDFYIFAKKKKKQKTKNLIPFSVCSALGQALDPS